MLPLYTSIVLLPALIVNAGVVTEQPTFWYPNPGASCGHINVAAADNDAFIGVCAVISSSARVYGCPANQNYCEASSQTCAAGKHTPGNEQKLCGASGAQWCCLASESCGSEASQYGSCLAPFASPVDDIDVQEAVATMQIVQIIESTSQRRRGHFWSSLASIMTFESAIRIVGGLILFVFITLSFMWRRQNSVLATTLNSLRAGAETEPEKLISENKEQRLLQRMEMR